jgi:hypothetical protein
MREKRVLPAGHHRSGRGSPQYGYPPTFEVGMIAAVACNILHFTVIAGSEVATQIDYFSAMAAFKQGFMPASRGQSADKGRCS